MAIKKPRCDHEHSPFVPRHWRSITYFNKSNTVKKETMTKGRYKIHFYHLTRPSPLCGFSLSPNPTTPHHNDQLAVFLQGLSGTFYSLFLLLSIGFVSNLVDAASSPSLYCVFSPYLYSLRDCVNYQTGLNSPNGGVE